MPEEEWLISSYDDKIKKTIGKINADLQITKFNNNAQPFYVLLNPYNETLLERPIGYELDVNRYIKFLEKGILEKVYGYTFELNCLVVIFSCKQSIQKDEILEAKVSIEEIKKSSIYLYGINIDSFNIIRNKIKWGQSFSNILLKRGVSNKIIYEANFKSKKIFNLKKIRKGKEYVLLVKKGSKAPSYFIYEPDKYSYIVYKLTKNISVNRTFKEITYHDKKISGIINSSLYISFDDNNFPIDLVNMMVDVFAWQVDFFKIMPGDRYDVFYTEEKIDGKTVGIKNIKAAKFNHQMTYYYAISYELNQGCFAF